MYDEEENDTENTENFVRPPQKTTEPPPTFDGLAEAPSFESPTEVPTFESPEDRLSFTQPEPQATIPVSPPEPEPVSPPPTDSVGVSAANVDTQPYSQANYYQSPSGVYVGQGAYTGTAYVQPPGGAGQANTQTPYGQPGAYAQPAYGQSAYGQPGYTQASYGGSGYTYTQPGYSQGAYTQAGYAQTGYGSQPPKPPGKPKKAKKLRKPMNLTAAALVAIIIVCCAASGVGGGLIAANLGAGAVLPPVGGEQNNIKIDASSDITVTEAVAKKVLSSVVGITATGNIVSEDFFFGQQEQEVTGVGTGMVLDKQGYILTNSHVVMDGTVSSIKVLLSTGEEVDGKVIWSDASLDLAIVKIEAESLSPVELGNSDEVAIGSYVAAIGNPLGLAFNGSITQGVVSGLGRTISVSDEMGSVVTMEDLIQVDAAINGGNSGGPLLNSKGQVIGVNTAKAQAEGMGFAIPINTAIPIIEKVIRDGTFERVYMGVSAADVSVIKENYPNVEILADTGAVVTDVNSGSPAEKAGLKVKDVITSIDGKEINGSQQLIKMLLGYESGDVIKVGYLRDGVAQETDLTLASQSELNRIQEEVNPFRNPPAEENPGQSRGGNSGNPFG